MLVFPNVFYTGFNFSLPPGDDPTKEEQSELTDLAAVVLSDSDVIMLYEFHLCSPVFVHPCHSANICYLRDLDPRFVSTMRRGTTN